MAVAFDAVTSATSTSGSDITSVSLTHDPVSATDGAVIVILSLKIAVTNLSVTYDGAAMTEVTGSPITNTTQVRIFYKTNSSVAAVTVSASWTESIKGAVMGCYSFTGVNQTTLVGTLVSQTGTGTSVSQAVTAGADDITIDGLAVNKAAFCGSDNNCPGVPIAGANQTERWNLLTIGAGTGGPGIRGFGSTEAGSNPTMSASWTNSNIFSYLAVPIKAAAAAARRAFIIS